jgi:hypothetical protein
MGVLGRLFAKKLTTFSFEFDPSFEQNSTVSIIEDLPLPEEYHAWVWSLYYAKTLYILGNGHVSNGLKEHLEQWAEPVVAGLVFPLQQVEEASFLVLDREMQLMVGTSLSKTNAEAYVLKVFKPPNDLPHIQTYQLLKGYQNRSAYSVMVLGQYFINKGKNCAREIDFDVLSMRKYYKEIKPFAELNSTIEAPVFALKEYKSFFDELNAKLDGLEKQSREGR